MRPFHFYLDLRRTDDVAGGHEADIDIANAVGFAIGGGLTGLREVFAVARRHGFERFGCGEDGAMSRAGMIGMAVRNDGAINAAANGVDVEIARRAIEALRRGRRRSSGRIMY